MPSLKNVEPKFTSGDIIKYEHGGHDFLVIENNDYYSLAVPLSVIGKITAKEEFASRSIKIDKSEEYAYWKVSDLDEIGRIKEII